MGQDGGTSNPADHQTRGGFKLSTHFPTKNSAYMTMTQRSGTYLAAQIGTIPADEPASWFNGFALLHRYWAWALRRADPTDTGGGTQTAPIGLLVLGAAELRSLPRLRKASDIGLEGEKKTSGNTHQSLGARPSSVSVQVRE